MMAVDPLATSSTKLTPTAMTPAAMSQAVMTPAVTDSAMAYTLQLVSGRTMIRSWAIPMGRLILGRSRDCDVQLDDDLVSRHHCVILRDEYTVRVRDLGSRNGTYVNTHKTIGERILQPGDVVTIGRLRIQFLAGPPRSHTDTRTEGVTTIDQPFLSSPVSTPGE